MPADEFPLIAPATSIVAVREAMVLGALMATVTAGPDVAETVAPVSTETVVALVVTLRPSVSPPLHVVVDEGCVGSGAHAARAAFGAKTELHPIARMLQARKNWPREPLIIVI
jgi:hypothetical protein